MSGAIMPAFADHNSNYIGTDELDKTFESGTIDWPSLFTSLDELNRQNGREKSLPRSRNSSGRKSLKRRTSETLSEPVDEDKEINHSSWDWEYRSYSLVRAPGYGFGIAISGGRDNPHFTTGEPSIVVSDVLRVGPAWGFLQVNDRIIEANGVNLENVDYAKAVDTMKDTDHLNMVIKRRIPVPTIEVEQRTLKFTLSKSKTKEDFGIVLGCKFYIKDITNPKLATKEPGLREGDAVISINGQSADDMSFKDAQKLLDKAKEKLSLVIQRDVPRGTCWKWPSQSTIYERVGPSRQSPAPSPLLGARSRCSSEGGEEKSGPSSSGVARLRGRINQRQSADMFESSNRSSFVSVGSRPRTPAHGGFELPPSGSNGSRPNSTHLQSTSAPQTPRISRPMSPNSSSNGGDISRSMMVTSEMSGPGSSQVFHKPPAHPQSPDVRCITFVKSGGSVGMRVIGGNEVGIFVSAVQLGSRAAERGVKPGDKILKVNGRDMKGMTREEAVLLLLGLQEQIELYVQHRQDEFERIRSQGLGDSFYIRTHFDFDAKTGEEISFKRGDILQVTDTLHGGLVGNWQAVKIYAVTDTHDATTPAEKADILGDGYSPSKGIIPSASRAEKLAASQMIQSTYKFNGPPGPSPSKSSPGLFKFRRRAASAGGDNHNLTSLDDAQAQLLKKSVDGHYDEVILGKRELIHDTAYERVQLRHPGFFRPVILYGPLADIAREKLLNEMPLRFATVRSSGGRKPEDSKDAASIRLSEIREVVARNKHCLLDVTPSSVERLNHAQQCPIVIFLNVDTRSRLKELRKRHSKESAMKNSRKLMELAIKIQKSHSSMFTAVLDASREENWFEGLSNLIGHLQERRVWMSECPFSSLDDDFLFPLNSKSNYESEMDVENYRDDIYDRTLMVNNENPNNNNNLMSGSMYENNHNSDPLSDNITNISVNSSNSSSMAPNSSRGQMHLSLSQRDCQRRNLPPKLNIMPESDMSISLNSAATDTTRSDASLTPTSPINSQRLFGQPIFDKGNSKNPLPDVLNAHNKTDSIHGSAHIGSVKLPFGSHLTRLENNYSSPADRRRSPATAYRYHSEPGVYDIRQILQADSDEYSSFVSSSNSQQNESRTATPLVHPVSPWQSRLNRPGTLDQPPSQEGNQIRNGPLWNRVERRSSNENRGSPLAFRPPMRTPQTPEIANGQANFFQDNQSVPFSRNYSSHQSGPTRPHNLVNPTRYNYLTQNDLLRGPQQTHTVVTNPQALPTTTLTVSPLTSPVDPNFNISAESGFISTRSKSPGTSMVNSRLHQSDISGNNNGKSNESVTPCDPVTIQPTQSRLARRFFSSSSQKGSRTDASEASENKNDLNFSTNHNSNKTEITTTATIETQSESNRQSQSPTTKVLGEVKGIVGPEGATFLSESTGVSIRIPPGALVNKEEIFFKVCGDDSIVLPLNKAEGEKLLSPLVMCGPKGLTFLKPVEIRLPHNEVSVNSEEWSFALKTGNSDESGNAEWENITLSEIKAAKRGQLEDGFISLLIDHF